MLSNTAIFFLKRPMLVTITIIAVFGLGIKNAWQARKEGFPEISLNRINIQTVYPGASARDVEFNITIPIEEALEGVEGIQELTSRSEEGISIVTIEADNSANDKQFTKIYNDVEQAITEVTDLPDDIDGKPAISEFTSGDIPIFEVAFQGQYNDLKPWLDDLEKRLTRLNTVAYVDIVGLPDPEVQILVNANKARQFNLGLSQIARAIQARNMEGSGGTLESFTSEKKVVFLSKFEEYHQILDTVLQANIGGFTTRLRDVATVKILPKDTNLIVRNNGKPGAVLSVKKTSSSDLLKVVDQVRDVLAQSSPPKGVSYKILLDQSRFTRDRIQLLLSNAAMGFVLVCIILYFVFDLKSAIWTAFGIPFSLFGLVSAMHYIGVSINMISLGGFILIIGMLVDDAIVIAEEVIANKEQGQSPFDAALNAVKAMGLPVIGAVLTTMIAFSPLFSVGGFPGKFIWAIPLMVIIGLLFSLFESFFILPSHLAHQKSSQKDNQKKAFILVMESYYQRMLVWVLAHSRTVALVLVALLVLSVVLLRIVILKDPFPQEAAEGFSLQITAPAGTPALQSQKIVSKIEDVLLKLPKEELKGFSTRIGTHSTASNRHIGTQANLAMIFVYLHPYSGRDRTALEIMEDVQTRSNGNLKADQTSVKAILTRLGPPMGDPIEVRVISNNDQIRLERTRQIKDFMSQIPGVQSVSDNEIEGKEELNLKVDYTKLALTGLQVADVLSALRIAFDGQIVSSMTTLDGEREFRLRLDEKGRSDPAFISQLPLTNQQGQVIQLGSFSHVVHQKSPAAFFHVHANRSTTITANVDLAQNEPVAVMQKIEQQFGKQGDFELEFAGQPVETGNIFADLGTAALVAFLGIFLLISLLLNSFHKGLIIMLPLPFLIIGVVFTLLSHSLPLSMLAGTALIGLMGVVVNDSIVMVHKIEEAIAAGFHEDQMVAAAVQRLRPVLLTTVTTVAGVLPTGYGIGGYDPFLSQMCVVTAYGLLFASLLTLFIVPMFYHIAHRKTSMNA